MIEGVVINSIKTFSDDRGWLKEIFRSDESSLRPEMSYVSLTNFNQVRGPHEHVHQSDFFVFIGPGDFELYLWDDRENSKTYNNFIKEVVGEINPVSVLVPPGVVHGYKSISSTGSFSINLPDRLYAGKGRKEVVDEIRHENDSGSKFLID